MRSEPSLARNTLFSAVSSASNVLLVVLVIIAARVLGERSFGYLSFALALASIFEKMTDLGLNTLTARNVARDRGLAGSYLPNMLGWKAFLSMVVIGLFALAVRFLNHDPEARTAAYIIGVAFIIQCFKATSVAFFQAYERFDLILLVMYVERASTLVLCTLVLLFVGKLIPFALVFTLGRIPDLVLAYWLIHRKVTPFRVRFEPRVIKSLQVSAIPLGAYALVFSAYWHIGTVVLSAMRPAAEVGWYTAGYKIYEGLTMFPFLLCAVLLPHLSRLFVADRDRHAALSLRMLRYLTLGSMPLAVSVGVLAPQAVQLLYGKAYLPGVPALRILLGATILMFINWTLNTVLISADREKTVLRVATAGLAVITVANLALIRQFGVVGAACSVAISELCVFMLLFVALKKVLFAVPAYSIAWRPAVACTSAAIVPYLSHLTAPVIWVLLFAALYMAMLVALGAFRAEEWSAVRSLFSPRRSS